jgi:O-antigen ligase
VMAESEDRIGAPPPGEQIHMPAPSILPVLNAAGLATAIVGITISMILVIAGLVLFLATAIVWIRGAKREMEDLPLDHHGH